MRASMGDNEILTVDDMCDVLLIGKSTAYRLLKENKVKGFQIKKGSRSCWKIPKKSIDDFIDASRA